jgi:serine/threonine-protein kinase RsbW
MKGPTRSRVLSRVSRSVGHGYSPKVRSGEAQPTESADAGAQAGVQLTLPARAENVAVVRHALAGLAAAFDMHPDAIADLKTVVTEACMNVVVHAYDDGGPLEVRAWPEDDELAIAVRDYGSGIRPRVDADEDSLRLGLPLIAALSESFEISGSPGRGTEVVMRLALEPDGSGPADERSIEVLRETRVRVPAGELAAPVLSRVIGMYAARADFTVDRLSDAILLSDAISSQEPGEFPDATAQVEITELDSAFSVRLGPLREGAGERLLKRMRIPELGASLEGLADEMSVQSDDTGEFVVMRIARPD